MTTKKSKPETRGRPRAFDKEQALTKALLLFWEKGYEDTAISDLTKIMGITPPSLYATFGNKEQLFWSAVELYTANYAVSIEKTLAENNDVKEAIYHLLKKLAKAYTATHTPYGCLIVCASSKSVRDQNKVNRVLREMRRISENLLVRKIEQAIQLKKLPKDTNAKSLGKFFATLIQGMSVQSRDGAKMHELMAIADLAMQMWPW